MISRNRIAFIRSLELKKGREKSGLFIAEGEKICSDLLKSRLTIDSLYYISSWKDSNADLLKINSGRCEMNEVDEGELKKISLLSTPNKVLAIASQEKHALRWEELTGAVILLDQVQDPGNLGTIIRTADWFGIPTIIAGTGSADLYNPKVIQAAMGSAFRIRFIKYELGLLLKENAEKYHRVTYAAKPGGENIFHCGLQKNGFFMFGNESAGISPALLSLSEKHIAVPQGPVADGKQPADSLNVAVAAAVVIAEYSRQMGA